MFAIVRRHKAKRESEVSPIQKVVPDDETKGIRLPIIVRRLIEWLRQEEHSVENLSPNISIISVGNVVIVLGKTENPNILAFNALEVTLLIREVDYENVTLATRQECKLAEDLTSDMDCDYFYLSTGVKIIKIPEARFYFVVFRTVP